VKKSSIKIVIKDGQSITTREVTINRGFVTVQDLTEAFLLSYTAAGFLTPLKIQIEGLASGTETFETPKC